MNKLITIIISIILVISVLIGVFFYIQKSTHSTNGITQKPYSEITTKNQGSYIVKNMVYSGVSIEFPIIEKIMKEIRAECQKPCKINLYSNREAYDLDIMAGESNFDGYTDQQKNYLSTHLLAFWGIDDGDNIEYYPSK